MKIMQLISSSQPYGAENVVFELCRELKDSGCDVALFNLANGPESGDAVVSAARAAGIEAHRVPCKGRFDLKAERAVRDFVVRNGISIIHSHGYKADFYAFLARRATTVKLMATCHNWPQESLTMKFYKWIDVRVLNTFDAVAVVSETLHRDLASRGVSVEKIVRIHNGIAAGAERRNTAVIRKELAEGWGIGRDDRIIGTVGRLSQEKGHKYLLRAIQDLAWSMPGVKAVIAGDGPLRLQLEAELREMKLDGVVAMLGRRTDVGELLGVFDVFVLPSLTEGMPVALLEAMAGGVPVVATHVGEIPRIVEDGRDGILVGKQDSDALAQACRDLLENRERAAAMAALAREKVRSKFSRKIMGDTYRKEYVRLLATGEHV